MGRDPLAPHNGVPRANGTQTKNVVRKAVQSSTSRHQSIGIATSSSRKRSGRRSMRPAGVARSRWPSPVRTDDDQRRRRRRQIQRGGGIAPVVSDDDGRRRWVTVDSYYQLGEPRRALAGITTA